MFNRMISYSFKDIVETDDIAEDIGIRMIDRISDACLSGQIDNDVKMTVFKKFVDELLVGNIAFDEGIILVQKKHVVNYHIDEEILKYISANIVVINKPTRGAVETCIAARPFIADSDAILILDCDLEWHCHNYMSMIAKLLQEDTSQIGGMLLSFESNDPSYSYAVVENGIVIRTAEKEPISSNALVGAYYFNTADDFFDSAFNLFENNELSDIKEYYVSLLYNYLIKSGKIVKLHKVDSLYSFGTPEELMRYEQLNV